MFKGKKKKNYILLLNYHKLLFVKIIISFVQSIIIFSAHINYYKMKCFRCSKKQYHFICNFCFNQYSIAKQEEKITIGEKKRFLQVDFERMLKKY